MKAFFQLCISFPKNKLVSSWQKQACVKLTQYITLGMNKQEMSQVGQTSYEPTRIWNNTSFSTEEEFWSLSVYWVMVGTSNLSRKRARAKAQTVKEERQWSCELNRSAVVGSEKHWEAWLFNSQNPEDLRILSLGK